LGYGDSDVHPEADGLRAIGARAITYSVVALLAAAAFVFTPPIHGRQITPAVSVVTHPAVPDTQRIVDTLRSGETLSQLFARAGVTPITAAAALKSAPFVDERRVIAGTVVTVKHVADSAPSEIALQPAIDRIVHLRRTGDQWSAQDEKLPWTSDTSVVSGTIHTNLYAAMDAGAPTLPKHAREELAWALADILDYRVDMSRDLQDGDTFRALFERQTGPEGVVRIGRVMATTFVLSRDTTEAVWFTGGQSKDGYYDKSGKSLRNAFLRAPLEFRRISSVFGMRKHPILGIWRQHKGTDYVAAQGTPVRAIGDAVVIFAGQKHGYGNVLDLRHRNGYVTRYGHLLRFASGIHVGARVEQGRTIAYVGMTGLATAPHLHFEVLVNGVQRDPRVALKSTGGEPLMAADRPAFETVRERCLAAMQSKELALK
ncbi:MAG TPA: M23 family metallopeptidase, partial [Gemmatimonadaceae bacterium]|nr:M23 family metallopeptidase [Gemmatimonadaceae bacterium]